MGPRSCILFPYGSEQPGVQLALEVLAYLGLLDAQPYDARF